MINLEFLHINLIAHNWKTLADFYIKVFGCMPSGPERDLSGSWVSRLTGIDKPTIKGIHLLLPGKNFQNITLEIFEYDPGDSPEYNRRINSRGYGHIAFHTENLHSMVSLIIDNGGSFYGEPVFATIEGIGKLHVVYMKDPEGNILELQMREDNI